MSGIIPGVGVPHRRRVSHRVNSAHEDPYFLGERSHDSSMDLSETALRARQRLEKKLSSCLCISFSSSCHSSNTLMGKVFKGKEKNNWGSSKSVNVKRSWKFTSIDKVEDSKRNVSSCC